MVLIQHQLRHIAMHIKQAPSIRLTDADFASHIIAIVDEATMFLQEFFVVAKLKRRRRPRPASVLPLSLSPVSYTHLTLPTIYSV